MNIISFSTIIIAILSLIISLYVLRRDRKNRTYDILYKCYDRLNLVQHERDNDNSTDDLNEEERLNRKYKSISRQQKIDSELEFACYLVYKEQIELETFFDLFKGWLAGRSEFWCGKEKYKAYNNPYTWLVIQQCHNKKLLPIKTNKDTLKIKGQIDTTLKNNNIVI
jgi:hypothetical protein